MSDTSWTSAGHSAPAGIDLDPQTQALAASIKLPAGFRAIAEDPDFGSDIFTGMAKVEKRLLDAVTNSDPVIDRASKHLAEAGGKRVRPLLVLISAMLGDGINDDVLQAATVVEMTHLATLYHDDVMDDAPLRRGTPTAQQVWGNSVAILTGDLILARASVLGAQLGTHAVALQAKTFERLCLGQLHEFVGPGEQDDPVAHYIDVMSDKTASLIAAAGEFGTYYGHAAPETIQILSDYGEKVGIAFQLADDVIDVTGGSKKAGKVTGTDLREGVPTLPVLLLRQDAAAGDAEAQRVLDLIDADLSSDEALAQAVEALASHPATQRAWDVAKDWSRQAIEALAPLQAGTVKEALEAFADAVVTREG
ncbi:MAG: polyprenyl synthetase family protein [Galactobacter sp.]